MSSNRNSIHPSRKFIAHVRLYCRGLKAKLVPLIEIMRLFYRTWPVSIVLMGLTLSYIVPGLAADQAREALLGYVSLGDDIQIVWGRYLLTVFFTISLGAVLGHSVKRLLDSGPPIVSASHRKLLYNLSSRFPTFAIAFGFYSLQAGLPNFPYPYAYMAAGLVCLHLVYEQSGAIINWLSRRLDRSFSFYHLTPFQIPFIALLVSFVVFIIAIQLQLHESFELRFISVLVAQALGPINILLISFAVWTAILSRIIIFSRKTRIPVLTGLTFIIVLNSIFELNDNHPIRRVVKTEPTILREIDSAFYSWIATRPDIDDYEDYPVIMVSSEGGGIRAALFTAISLARIADRCPQAANHIFAISGVSGGAVGAAIYAAAMKARPPNATDRRCDFLETTSGYYENAFYSILTDDHLSPILLRMFSTDAIQQLLPFPIDSFDRQMGWELSLQHSFIRAFESKVLGESLYQLVPTETAPSVPYLFMNATRVENGRRITMSPLYFRTSQSSGSDDWHAIDYLEGPSAVAAAGTSARFPIISPPGYYISRSVVRDGSNWIEDKTFRGSKNRYVDGGFFDNSATPTLLELYRELSDVRFRMVGPKGKKTFSMITLQIGNAPSCDITAPSEIFNACKFTLNKSTYSGVGSEILDLIRTVLKVRDARVEYGISQLEVAIDSSHNMRSYDPGFKGRPIMFDGRNRVQMLDRGIPTPLGWLLSQRAAQELVSQLDPQNENRRCDHENAGLTIYSNFCQLYNTVGILNQVTEPK